MAVIALIAATRSGRLHAERLAEVLPDAHLLDGRPSEALRRAFPAAEGLVLFLTVGAAVRLLAPLLADKQRDPGVVCVDEAARFAVALVGGHAGGANRLAERVAATFGATPVITTASDSAGLPALDALGAELGFRIAPGSELATVATALLDGEPVALLSDQRWPLGPLPANVKRRDAAERGPALVISDRVAPVPEPAVVYRPPSLVVGVGCRRGAPASEILELVHAVLAEAGLAAESVCALASVENKREERGLLEAAATHAWPLRFFSAGALAATPVPTPSEAVRQAVGTASVAEAAALREAAAPVRLEEMPRLPELVIAKRSSAMATVAVARRPVRGRLALVSLGPGDEMLLPPHAREALASAELVIGLERYVESVRHLLRAGARTETYAMHEEIERCRRACAEARAGGSVALVSSGDVGVYAMASPLLEQAELEGIDVCVVPGISAANAAAALVGAPLGHDHCAISLSDLLTPWGQIERRIRAASAADFVISFYNPCSRARDWQLERAQEILLADRPNSTPVAIVSDAYRPAQAVTLTTLAGLDCELVSMRTTVIVGSSQTRLIGGWMVTPRGYAPRSA